MCVCAYLWHFSKRIGVHGTHIYILVTKYVCVLCFSLLNGNTVCMCFLAAVFKKSYVYMYVFAL